MKASNVLILSVLAHVQVLLATQVAHKISGLGPAQFFYLIAAMLVLSESKLTSFAALWTCGSSICV